MALNVGALVGHLQLNTQDWDRGINTAKGRVAAMAVGAAKTVGAGVMAAGAAAGAGLSYSLYRGFGRLSALDQAEKKLLGLGNTGSDVQKIMDNALAAVRGTAYGMDAAATVAASTVAAGVAPGRELERTLKLVADASTIAGSSMEEMGAIFNKAATSNKVQGEILNQLGDRGIPIVQLLAREMGVTAEAVYEMSRKGQINFATFQAAMESGLGGAAQASGDTFVGAMANVNAAVGRVGANLLSGIFPQLAPLLQEATGWLGALEDRAEPMGEALGEAFAKGVTTARELVTEWLPLVRDRFYDARFGAWMLKWAIINAATEGRAKLEELLEPLGGIEGAFQRAATAGQDGFARVQTGATGLVEFLQTGTLSAAAAEALGPLANPTALGGIASVRDAINQDLIPALRGAGEEAGLSSGAISETLTSLLGTAIDYVGGRAREALPFIADTISWIGEKVGELTAIWAEHKDWLLPALEGVGSVLLWVADTVFGAFLGMLSGVMTAIDGVIQIGGGLLDFFKGVFTGDWALAWDGIKGIGTGALDLIKGAVEFFWNFGLVSLFRKGIARLTLSWTGGLNAIKAAPGAIWESITKGVSTFWDDVVRFFGQGATRMVDEVALRGLYLLDWFRALPGRIVELIAGLPGLLMQAGSDAAAALMGGLTRKFPWVGEVIAEVMGGGQSAPPPAAAPPPPAPSAGGGSFGPPGGSGTTFYVTNHNPVAATDWEQITSARALTAQEGY